MSDADTSAATAPSARYRPDPTGGCPHAAHARLLAEGRQVVPVVLPGEVPGAAVIGHEALKEFLTHPGVGKDVRHFAALREGGVPEGWPLATFAHVRGMTTADGTDHRRLRSLVSRAFTPRRVAELRPRVVALTAQLLDGLERRASESDGIVDLHRHFALPLPLSVIGELLGVGSGHLDRLHHLSTRLVSTDIGPQEAVAANREMVALLTSVVEERRTAPGDDLTSALLAAREEDGDRLDAQELVGTLLLMVVAGHETTLNLIVNAVRALGAHPDQLDLVRRSRASWADVVEETLRWDGPVSLFPFRYPVRDIEIGGTVLRRGTPVLAGYSAAGRDPAAHGPDADRFRVARVPLARHLSLGHGAHFCLGAPLARMEAEVALGALFGRFPGLRPVGADTGLPRHPSFVGNGVLELPVRLGTDAPAP